MFDFAVLKIGKDNHAVDRAHNMLEKQDTGEKNWYVGATMSEAG